MAKRVSAAASLPWAAMPLVLLLLLGSPLPAAAATAPPPAIDAEAVVLIDARTGDVLYGRNENAPLPMASTTKVMTSLLLIEAIGPQETMWIPSEVRGITGSRLYLEPGDRYLSEELLEAMMISSANDAAVAVAVNVAGSVENFVAAMNRRAERMGLRNTHFSNPHGLHDPEHYTSALDLSQIGRAAMRHERFRRVAGLTSATLQSSGLNRRDQVQSHNRFLLQYPWATGMKTGFTSAAGFCLIGSAEREGVELIGVILGGRSAEGVAEDMKRLMDWGFSSFRAFPILSPETPLTFTHQGENGVQQRVAGRPLDPISILLPADAEPDDVRVELALVGDWNGDDLRLVVRRGGTLLQTAGFRVESVVEAGAGTRAGDGESAGLRTAAQLVGQVPIWLVGGTLLGLGLLWARQSRRRRRAPRWSRIPLEHLRGWPDP